MPVHLQGWFVYPPGIMRDIINFNTDCAIVFHACPEGRLFSACRKNHRKKRQQIKKSADRDIISSAHWRDDKRCYVHVYLLRLPQ
ncbi:hypothetical protein F2Z75_24385 [Escherichia coli]|nr:hypothetical protein [Escherichia coli]